MQALLVVEAAQVAHTVSPPLRWAASGLYGVLGAPLAAAACVAPLNLKHIQHDTISGESCNPSCRTTRLAEQHSPL